MLTCIPCADSNMYLRPNLHVVTHAYGVPNPGEEGEHSASSAFQQGWQTPQRRTVYSPATDSGEEPPAPCGSRPEPDGPDAARAGAARWYQALTLCVSRL